MSDEVAPFTPGERVVVTRLAASDLTAFPEQVGDRGVVDHVHYAGVALGWQVFVRLDAKVATPGFFVGHAEPLVVDGERVGERWDGPDGLTRESTYDQACAFCPNPATTTVWQEAMGAGRYQVPACAECAAQSLPDPDSPAASAG